MYIPAFAQAILGQVDPSRASCLQSQQPGTDYRQFECHDGLLFFNKLLYVPNGSCRLQVVYGILLVLKHWI